MQLNFLKVAEGYLEKVDKEEQSRQCQKCTN